MQEGYGYARRLQNHSHQLVFNDVVHDQNWREAIHNEMESMCSNNIGTSSTALNSHGDFLDMIFSV